MTVSKLATINKYDWQSGGNFGQIIRKPINKIVLHHNAGTGINVVPNCWVSRQASAHYQIENGTIISCLDEDITGWHCGAAGADNNSHTIGIEHQNSTGAPDWKVSAENQEKSAQLVAEICQRRNIPIDRNHIVRHREMPNCQTACSGGLDIEWIVKRAKEIAGQATHNNSANYTRKGEINMYLIFAIDTGNWYVSNGVQCKWVKTERMLKNYQNEFGKLNLRVDKMYSSELYAEFPQNKIIK